MWRAWNSMAIRCLHKNMVSSNAFRLFVLQATIAAVESDISWIHDMIIPVQSQTQSTYPAESRIKSSVVTWLGGHYIPCRRILRRPLVIIAQAEPCRATSRWLQWLSLCRRCSSKKERVSSMVESEACNLTNTDQRSCSKKAKSTLTF